MIFGEFMIFGDWKPLLAKIEISDGEEIYDLEIGYLDIDHDKLGVEQYKGELYIRLRDRKDHLIRGGWVSIFGVDAVRVSPKLCQLCVDTAIRVEKLKAFL